MGSQGKGRGKGKSSSWVLQWYSTRFEQICHRFWEPRECQQGGRTEGGGKEKRKRKRRERGGEGKEREGGGWVEYGRSACNWFRSQQVSTENKSKESQRRSRSCDEGKRGCSEKRKRGR